MWNLFMQRDKQHELPESATNFGSRAKRRRRMPFAGAEPLENRALLSATGDDSPIDLSDNVPAVPADVMSVESNADVSFDGADLPFVNRFGQIAASSNVSDELFASIAQAAPSQSTSIGGSGGFDSSFVRSLSADTPPTVELRVAETGQLVAVTSAASVQDSDGLTINDDNSPTTYLRSMDSDGQAHSRLVFVTRTSRSAPIAEPQFPIDLNGAIVADSEISDEALSDQLASRPDLHDLETALDDASLSASPHSQHDGASQTLAAASRTRWTNSSRVSPRHDRELRALDTRRDDAVGSSISLDTSNNESDTDFNESSAMPIFDPTTRNVVLSVCLLGSLARATARRRRRMKVALAR